MTIVPNIEEQKRGDCSTDSPLEQAESIVLPFAIDSIDDDLAPGTRVITPSQRTGSILKALGIEVREGIRSSNRSARTLVLEKVVKISSTSSTNGNEEDETIDVRGFESGRLPFEVSSTYRPLAEKYRPLSSTPEVSSTYRPLTEPIQGKGFNPVVDDVDDVDDKNAPFSKQWKFWTKIQTSVEVLKIDGDRARIRVPGKRNSQWVPLAELREGAV